MATRGLLHTKGKGLGVGKCAAQHHNSHSQGKPEGANGNLGTMVVDQAIESKHIWGTPGKRWRFISTYYRICTVYCIALSVIY